MSKRNLKKNINSTMELLYSDCVFYKVFAVDADKDAADKVIEHIAEVHSEYIKRVSTTEGKDVKGRVKTYYQKLRADFKEQVNALGKEIATLP